MVEHKGPEIISGYDNDLYADKLREWRREETVAYSQVASRKKEVIWMNFEPYRIKQMELFGGE